MTSEEFVHQPTLLDLQQRRQDARSATMRVLTWNVQHASAARARRQAAWVAAEVHADVVLLTEVSWGDGGLATAQTLSEYGYSVLVPAGRYSDYGVMVAGRGGRLAPVDVGAIHLPYRFLGGTLTVDNTRGLGVVALYVPSRGPKDARNVAKRAFQKSVAAALPGLNAAFGPLHAGLMVGGDLNIVEPNHTPRHQVFGAWEYEFYRAFAASGFVDAYRHFHPADIEHSWFGRRSGEGYRFDHLFASKPELLVDCHYLHTPREAGLSDHSAMIAVLSVGTVANVVRPPGRSATRRPAAHRPTSNV